MRTIVLYDNAQMLWRMCLWSVGTTHGLLQNWKGGCLSYVLNKTGEIREHDESNVERITHV